MEFTSIDLIVEDQELQYQETEVGRQTKKDVEEVTESLWV